MVGWCELSHLHDMDVTLVDPLQVKNGKGTDKHGFIRGNLSSTAMHKLRQGKPIENVAECLGTSSLLPTSDQHFKLKYVSPVYECQKDQTLKPSMQLKTRSLSEYRCYSGGRLGDYCCSVLSSKDKRAKTLSLHQSISSILDTCLSLLHLSAFGDESHLKALGNLEKGMRWKKWRRDHGAAPRNLIY